MCKKSPGIRNCDVKDHTKTPHISVGSTYSNIDEAMQKEVIDLMIKSGIEDNPDDFALSGIANALFEDAGNGLIRLKKMREVDFWITIYSYLY